ncbi:MAG: ABC transporter ATP-binding protein [Anaerolineae bacterium]
MLLSVENLEVAYGHIKALHGISFHVDQGEIVALIGANGAGKSTTLRAISRLIPVQAGSIRYDGKNLLELAPHDVVKLGVAHVPEGRRIFGNLTVMENLKLAAYNRKDRHELARDFERIFALFPRLSERKEQRGDTLSGGEQQMLAVARALMTRGRLMLLDEPSMGLAPVLMRDLFRVLREINEAGTTILLVEQNARMALKFAQRCYVLETGTIVLEGSSKDLANNPAVKEAYLGA